MAVMALGKLIVVTRLVATGTPINTFSSRKSFKISLEGCANATLAVSTEPVSNTVTVDNRSLTVDFIFEVAHGGGEASVQGHVAVADEAEPERERKRLGERLVLKNAAADDLAGDGGETLVFACSQDVNAADLGFLMQLLGTKFNGLADAF